MVITHVENGTEAETEMVAAKTGSQGRDVEKVLKKEKKGKEKGKNKFSTHGMHRVRGVISSESTVSFTAKGGNRHRPVHTTVRAGTPGRDFSLALTPDPTAPGRYLARPAEKGPPKGRGRGEAIQVIDLEGDGDRGVGSSGDRRGKGGKRGKDILPPNLEARSNSLHLYTRTEVHRMIISWIPRGFPIAPDEYRGALPWICGQQANGTFVACRGQLSPEYENWYQGLIEVFLQWEDSDYEYSDEGYGEEPGPEDDDDGGHDPRAGPSGPRGPGDGLHP